MSPMNPMTSALLTDLYQFTMLEGYMREGMDEAAVFEFYVRCLPPKRGFLVAAGLDSFLGFLENAAFSAAEIAYLHSTGRFSDRLLDYLRGFRFRGDIYAMPEGTVFFANEPVIQIIAPLPEAQFIETRLINLIQFETLIASKAARCTLAAAGRAVLVDFGLRRAHGAEAGLLAARASFMSGFVGTSTVLAEMRYGIPVFGTMAHSYIEAHTNEEEAFIEFARANPGNVTLLIDTYDTLRGARCALSVARRLKDEGIVVRSVRLDSGDILPLSREVRRILDKGGFPEIRIFVSGNMDEFAIRDLLSAGAPINGFGVGTKLDTSADAPYLECAYKLMEYAGEPRLKQSTGKATLPGRKQVYRQIREGAMVKDILTVDGDVREGEPLLQPVMRGGNRLHAPLPLAEIAVNTRSHLAALPPQLQDLETEPPYTVEIAPALQELTAETERRLKNHS
jgi:nicotinate phosphoribosyltransferase